jgi:hypothetical protein
MSSINKKYLSIDFYTRAGITNINNVIKYYKSLHENNKILSIMLVIYAIRLLPKLKLLTTIKSKNLRRELNNFFTTAILSAVILVLAQNHSINIYSIVEKILSKINGKKILSGCKYIVAGYIIVTMCIFLCKMLNKIFKDKTTTKKNNMANIIKICSESVIPAIFFIPNCLLNGVNKL